ncbi:MAG: hypothetical protein DLM50_06170 [Candidatus Meridianibacter frigidus]|nr:MAG: hypothetical protein DLM50_06170 [Candidatus Eremiobacteraeota bacterium]
MVSNLRGRPRNLALNDRILRATLEAIAEHGIAGATVDDIAARSCVSKPTMYARWASRDELLVAALRRLRFPSTQARGSRPRLECVAVLRAILESRAGKGHTVAQRLLAELGANPEIESIFRELIVQPPRIRCEQAIRNAIDARELSVRTDVTLAVDLLVGPMFYHRFIQRGTPQFRFPEKTVDAVWRAFAPDSEAST